MTSAGETAQEEEEGAGGTVGTGVGWCLWREAERGPRGGETAPERKGGSGAKVRGKKTGC